MMSNVPKQPRTGYTGNNIFPVELKMYVSKVPSIRTIDLSIMALALGVAVVGSLSLENPTKLPPPGASLEDIVRDIE